MTNIPNILTSLRLLLVPFLILQYHCQNYGWALTIFLIAGLTDVLDGLAARLLKQQSNVGAFLDPLADKTLLNSSFIALSILGIMPVWLTLMVFSRDFLIFVQWRLFLRFAIRREIRYRATFISKLNTFFQVTTILLALFVAYKVNVPLYMEPMLGFTQITTALLTFSSGVHYIYLGLDEFE